MINKDDLKTFKELITEFRPNLGFFEREILIPQIWDRLNYTREIFENFRSITEDIQVATIIDAAARNVVLPEDAKKTEPSVGQHYLSQIRLIMINSYIDPIVILQSKYPKEEIIKSDLEKVISFFNEAKMIFESISTVKESMFHFTMRGVVNIRDVKTSEVLYAPLKEISIVLAPFENRMSELVNVSAMSSESIKLWHESLKEQTRKHVEMIANISQVKSAFEQTVAVKWNIFFQVTVIIFALVGIIFSQPVGTYIEKRVIEVAYQEKLAEIENCQESMNENSSKNEFSREKSIKNKLQK